MKKIRFIICLLLAVWTSLNVEAAECFRLNAIQKSGQTIHVNRIISESHSFRPAFQRGNISGLSIDGNITRLSDDYFVRILLKDTKGKEYVVLELYSEIDDSPVINLRDFCEETILLNFIQPDSIKIFLVDAELNLERINYTPEASPSEAEVRLLEKKKEEVRKEQASVKAEKINVYNRKYNKLWRAAATSVSQLDYEVKKRVMGFADDSPLYGYEYYAGGIFEIGKEDHKDEIGTNSRATSPYVDHFDWRNRHGKNWMTSIKKQFNSKYCTFFATAGAIEAVANLYYNRQLDLDLSEQEMASCHQHHYSRNDSIHGYNQFTSGHEITEGLEYVTEHGVINEGAYPFVNDSNQICLSGQIEPDTVVEISGYAEHLRLYNDSIKKAIINNGPLVSGHNYLPLYNLGGTIYYGVNSAHAMTLVGYGTIHEGDTITMNDDYGRFFEDSLYVIPANDDRIGMTYWIFKNSWGGSPNDYINGYQYLLIRNWSCMYNGYSVKTPITIKNGNGNDYFTEADIVCEDRDGDGYYFWGIGPKPALCPSWVLDTPDGDDSDINTGPMNQYGYLDTLPIGSTIDSLVIYSTNNSTSYRLGVVNGGILTITGTTTLTGSGHIRVCEGGTLIVDGGTINNADITLIPGCTVVIRNNGKINMANGKNFDVPQGAIVQIDKGEINNT